MSPEASRLEDGFEIEGLGWTWPATKPSADAAVVLVHGWFGDCKSTWERRTRTPRAETAAGCSLAQLAATEADCPLSVYSLGHPLGPFSTKRLEAASGLLRTLIKQHIRERHILLVGHSLGGLVCRDALLRFLGSKDDRLQGERVLGLLTYATPHSGVDIHKTLNLLSLVSTLGGVALSSQLPALGPLLGRVVLPAASAIVRAVSGSGSTAELETGSALLRRLNEEWLERVIFGSELGVLSGANACFALQAVIGTRDRVVSDSSASALFLSSQQVSVDKSHTELPKPRSRNDATYVALRRFVEVCLSSLESRSYSAAERQFSSLASRSYHDRSRVVDSEREVISLLPEPVPLSRSSGGGGSRLRALQVHVERDNVVCSAKMKLGVAIESSDAFSDCLYVHRVGRSLLSEEEFLELAEAIRTDSDPIALRPLFSATRLTVQQGEKTVEYVAQRALSLRNDRGWLVELEAGSDLDWTRRCDRLVLDFESRSSLAHGWYGFYSGNSVLKSLEVTLQAPFPIRPVFDRWWTSNGLGITAPCGQTTRGRFTCTVSGEGPFPRGTTVIWLYRATESDSDSKEEETHHEEGD